MSYSYRRYYNTSGSGNPSDPNDPYIKSLEDQIKEQFETITKQKLQINDQTVRIHQLEADLDHARRTGNSTSSHLKVRFEDLDRQYRHQIDIISQLNDQVKRLKQQNFDLQSEKISLQHDLSHGSTFRTRSRTDADTAQEELIENLKYEIKCDQKENENLREKIDKLEEKIESLEADATEKNHKIVALQSELGRPIDPQTESRLHEAWKKENSGRDSKRGEGDDDGFRILEASTLSPKDMEIRALKHELMKMHEESERNAEQLGHLRKLRDQLSELHGHKSFEDVAALLSQIKHAEKVNNRLEEIATASGHRDVPTLLSELDRMLIGPPQHEQLQYFSGTIVNNRKTGYGVEIDVSGQKYSGMFKNGQRHGLGKLEAKEFEFTGHFDHGQFEREKGLYKKFTQTKTLNPWEGVTYDGEVEGDQQEGKGRLIFPNGIEYTGGFKNGRIDIEVPGSFKVNDDVYEVSVLDLKDMGIMIISTPDKTQTWVLNTKTGSIQKS
jgi:uncharacterized coiled-coil protein SlyX